MENINPRKRLDNLIGQVLSTKEEKVDKIGGILGTYDDAGNEIVDVESRPDFVYVRIGGDFGETVEAFNQEVFPEFDVKVLLVKSSRGNFYEVFGRDLAQYNNWDNNAYLPIHADSHIFGDGDNVGNDPVFIYKRQLLQPLSVHPNPTGSMSAVVEGDFYIWNNSIKYFSTADTVDFTNLLPTGTENRYITVYLDGNSESIKYVTGSLFNASIYTTGTTDFIPEIDLTLGIPLGAVYLTTGTTEIDWDHLFDIRNFLNAGGNSTIIHGLDPSHGYHSGTLRASQVTAIDINNYFTGTVVEDILQELGARPIGGGGGGSGIAIFDDSIFKITGTAISFDSNLSVVITGSTAYISASGGGTIDGIGANGRVAYWTGSNGLGGDSGLTYNNITGVVNTFEIKKEQNATLDFRINNPSTGTSNRIQIALYQNTGEKSDFAWVASDLSLRIINRVGAIEFYANNSGPQLRITLTGTVVIPDRGTQYGGLVINEQTGGGSINTNLHIGSVTIQTGTWSVYNQSTRTNYFNGSLGIGTGIVLHKLDVLGNVRLGVASGASGSRILGRGEHTSAPGSVLAIGEWEMSLYDNGVTPVFRVRYNDGGSIKSIDLGPLV